MFTRALLLSCVAVACLAAGPAIPKAGKRPLERLPVATFLEEPEQGERVLPPFRRPAAPRPAIRRPAIRRPLPAEHTVNEQAINEHTVNEQAINEHGVNEQTVNEQTAIPREWLRPAFISAAVDNVFHQHHVISRLWQHHLNQLEHLPALSAHLPALSALSRRAGDAREAGNANAYVDMVLANLNAFLPAKFVLPDLGTPVHLTDCYTVGLDNGLHRSQDSTFATVDKTVKFNGGFKMSNFGVHCHWKYLLMGGQATITAPNVDIELAMQLHIDSGESPQFTQLLVKDLAKFEVEISGVPTMNWAIADIVEGIINGYIDTIISTIETMVPAAIQGVFDSLVLP